jgi:hypothetical protein
MAYPGHRCRQAGRGGGQDRQGHNPSGRGGVDGLAVAEDRVDQLLTLPAGSEDRGNGPLSPGGRVPPTPLASAAPEYRQFSVRGACETCHSRPIG